MNILLTNDDGIESDGLHILADTLRKKHSVWISAPAHERSASSHSISLHKSVEFICVEDQSYTCSGTPADCVLFALAGAVPVTPDVVISGINRGNNIGVDTVFSGTVAAARQAVFSGIPAIAVSAAGMQPPFPFQTAADFVDEHLESFVALWNGEMIININVPEIPDGTWRAATLSRLGYENSVHKLEEDPENSRKLYQLGGTPARTGEAALDSDFVRMQGGSIAVTPLLAYPRVDDDSIEKMKDGSKN